MILDELDKQGEDEIKDLNTALEHNIIEIHKAGINQTFNCRCPIIGILNPKYARFDDHEPYIKQVKVPADTLSRFDLIFLIRDIADDEKDTKIAAHLGAIWQQLSGNKKADDPEVISTETLRKYIAYARTFNPRIPDDVIQAINSYYLKLRKGKDNGDTITATARDYNAICRLTISLAKLRLSSECSIDDVERAIAIHKASQDIIRDPTTGKSDANLLHGGPGPCQLEKIKTIKEIIMDLQTTGEASIDDIISIAKVREITRETAYEILNRLKRDGDLLEVRNGLYRMSV